MELCWPALRESDHEQGDMCFSGLLDAGMGKKMSSLKL